MPERDHCTICGTPPETVPPVDPHFVHQKCPRCGEFKLTSEAWEVIGKSSAADRVKISGWVSDQNRAGTVPRISDDVLKRVLARGLPTFAERADLLLLEAVRWQEKLGDYFNIKQPRFVAATYSQNDHEAEFLLGLLVEQNLVKLGPQSYIYQVLPRGYIAVDKLTRRVASGDKGFVAMWFDEDLKSAYEIGFQLGILNAGYDPVRMDRVEHANRIDDEIIAHIRMASFVVADFTGHRGGVYFEAGFALGLGRQVIWTCQKADIKDLHFDIRQYNTIDWEDPEDLATRLQHRIEATVGKGPKTVFDS